MHLILYFINLKGSTNNMGLEINCILVATITKQANE